MATEQKSSFDSTNQATKEESQEAVKYAKGVI